jgi:hypothetical protein
MVSWRLVTSFISKIVHGVMFHFKQISLADLW